MSRLPEAQQTPLPGPVILRAAALTLLIALTTPALADSGLLNAGLGRWLDADVLPDLGRTLGEHPRFKGETIKLVSLTNGQPTDRTSRLHKAVEARLTQQLLRSSGARIAWTDQPTSPCRVSQPVNYLLGVEIERQDRRHHRLSIRMIDVAEGIWVSGVSHSWQGQLTDTESAALAQSVSTAPLGTVDSPLPAASSREIARTMHEQLRCAHPQGLDGPVYLEGAAGSDLNRVVGSLTAELTTAPLAALTGNRDRADWVLSLQPREAGSTVQGGQLVELGLLLTDKSGGVTQQVATVYMTGAAQPAGGQPAQTRVAAGLPTATRAQRAALLSQMRLERAADEGICDARRARGNQCAEVTFDLYEDAYLFVLSSSDRQLSSSTCESRLVPASAGERRFRVRVPPSLSDLPDAGIYAIAVSDRDAAKALSRHIRQGVCSRPLNRSEVWLEELDRLLSAHPATAEWRAIHLVHSASGVERL